MDIDIVKRFIYGAKEAYKKVDNHSYNFPITIESAYRLATNIETLLKEQEPRVLTTDELFYMEHQGVYIERRNSKLYPTEPAIVLRTSVCEPSFGGSKYILMRENKLSESRWACDYNKDIRNGWRCWTSKPTEEQRKAVKWG